MPSRHQECVVHPRNSWQSVLISTYMTLENLSSAEFNASTPPSPRNAARQRRLQRGHRRRSNLSWSSLECCCFCLMGRGEGGERAGCGCSMYFLIIASRGFRCQAGLFRTRSGMYAHYALHNAITLLLEPRVAELVCVGVGIAGTWSFSPFAGNLGLVLGLGDGGRGPGWGEFRCWWYCYSDSLLASVLRNVVVPS